MDAFNGMRRVALPAIMNGARAIGVIDLRVPLARLLRKGENFREHVEFVARVPQTLTFDARGACLESPDRVTCSLLLVLFRRFCPSGDARIAKSVHRTP